MEILLVLYGLAWLVQNFAVETVHARAGSVSPRWQAKLMKLAREGQPGYVPRYGSRDFFADLWGDHLKAKTQARRAAAEAKLYDEPLMERVRRVVESGKAERERATAEAPDIARPEPSPAAPVIEPTPAIEEPVVDAPRCINCGAPCEKDGALWCDKCRELYPSRPSPIPDPDRADARVIPMFKREQVADMSTEVTGLDPALAYAQQVANAHEAHSTAGDELFINGLEAKGVGPSVVGKFRAAMLKSGEAAAYWRDAAAALADTNKSTQQSYIENPEAGDKRFQLDGR